MKTSVPIEDVAGTGTTKLNRLEGKYGSVKIELTSEDLNEIEFASSRIEIKGQRYSEANQKMIDD